MRLLPVAALVVCFAVPAAAQKIVVLEIDGDAQGKLRTQIEGALKAADVVELVSLKTFKDIAARKKLKGGAAMTPAGVARVARTLAFDAAVGGEVDGSTYRVLIFDRTGEELWKKELAVKKGVLSDDFAGKLARAIAAAGAKGATIAAAPSEPDDSPGLDLTQTDGSGRRGVITGKSDSGGQPDERDTDLENPNRVSEKPRVPVKLVRGWITGATTWRNQCLRPGVATCKEYDLAATQPSGISIDFTATVPYVGFAAYAEVFPLALLNQRVLQGFGLMAGLQYGQSQTRIVEETPQGQGPEKVVKSDDVGFLLQLAWRFHFQMGYFDPEAADDPQPVAWVGINGGFQSRSFLIDPTAGTSLPSSQRTSPTGIGFPTVGAHASIPINKYIRFEGAFHYYFVPKPSEEQIVGYGNLMDPTGGVVSTGFGAEFGVAGDIWGPLGYVVRWRYQGFVDRFYGQGRKWTVCNETQCGGVGEESFHTILWGVTAAF